MGPNDKNWNLYILHLMFFMTFNKHYNDVIMSAIATQITSLTIVYSTISGEYQRKHQSSASLTFVRGIHRWSVNFPHKRPVTRKMFQFDDVIMIRAWAIEYIPQRVIDVDIYTCLLLRYAIIMYEDTATHSHGNMSWNTLIALF